MPPLLIIEKLSIAAPLGVCFHDAATGERVTGGLNVSVYPDSQRLEKDNRKNRTFAFPNRRGVYVLHKARGLKNFPFGEGDAQFWNDNPPQKLYVAEVFDTERRFQPFYFTVKLPVKGIYKWQNIPASSPNKNISSIPLYSAPARKVSDGMSVIRAHLRRVDDKPASWAVLEARLGGNLVARGIADRDGQIALIFPSLPPQNNPIASPPEAAASVSLAEQKWMLDLTVKYQPGIFQSSPPNSTESDEEVFPDLRLALAQAEGKLWTDAGQTEEFKTAVLQFGKELILRPRKSEILSPMSDEASARSSFLFISPAV
ncbi:MAG TPA: hypothetical protein VK892_21815 [Pyrinomonadaceae bacterium]|nr:hypothetical protein [Pyrinomonadaceae bacterium]